MDWILDTAGDPPEGAVVRSIRRKLDELVPPRGPFHAFREPLLDAVLDILASDPFDVIEAVASLAPGTRNLVMRFRVSDRFDAALTRAAKDLMIGTSSHDSSFH